MVYIRDGGVGPRGRASLYKTLLSLAPPPPGLEPPRDENTIYSYFENGCRKNVHVTIPKDNMGYDQHYSCRTYFWRLRTIVFTMQMSTWQQYCHCFLTLKTIVRSQSAVCILNFPFWRFPLALANIRPCLFLPFSQISLRTSKLKTIHNTFRNCCSFSE